MRASLILFALLFVLLALNTPRGAYSQSLVHQYRSAQFKAQAERVFVKHGRTARVLPVQNVPYQTDSLREWIELVFPPEEKPVEVSTALHVSKWTLVPKLGRSWFTREFADVRWAYIGSNTFNPIDTAYTRELRARLESEFGAPTQTLADLGSTAKLQPGQNIQFEYWFVLNDTIPLLVMDVNGPFERGLVVASEQRFRNMLPEIKEAFLGRLARSRERAPYVDYYYLNEQKLWFRTGYDGRRFFLDRIQKPDLKLGRPILD